ncbi:MAG: Rpn family recombination-promoting nuclease/putative transposase [Bacteroidales bacterium]|nr:Rpn family recombination-promoting nuclease/putative transposase [Bacteroidales bacterium]
MENYIRFDWAIKRLLRDKADFGVVNGFLSCLLEKQISITQVLESEGNKRRKRDKINRVDILVEDETGEKIIIEIQNNDEIDYYQRMLYGVSKVVCDYLKEGDKYEKIKKIYSVNIVYFKFGDGEDYVYHGYTEFRGIHTGDLLKLTESQQKRIKREKVSDIYPEYYVLRVENFDDVAKTPLDEWIYFLKNTAVPEKITAPGLKEAQEKLRIDNLSEEEKRDYYDHLKNMNYAVSAMEASWLAGEAKGWKKGWEKGWEEGEAIGIEKGETIGREKARAENKVKEEQTVINSYHADIPTATIAAITNLTVEQVIEILKRNGIVVRHET